jgi:hypothetical protein
VKVDKNTFQPPSEKEALVVLKATSMNEQYKNTATIFVLVTNWSKEKEEGTKQLG